MNWRHRFFVNFSFHLLVNGPSVSLSLNGNSLKMVQIIQNSPRSSQSERRLFSSELNIEQCLARFSSDLAFCGISFRQEKDRYEFPGKLSNTLGRHKTSRMVGPSRTSSILVKWKWDGLQ